MADGPRRPPLWVPGDVVLLYGLNILCVALLLGSAWATTAAEDLSARVAWVNLGVLGLLVAGVGNTFWLLAGRRAVGRRRTRLLAAPDPDVVAAPTDAHQPAPVQLVALGAASRFHRDGCALVVGKPVVVASRARHERAGLRACGVCQP